MYVVSVITLAYQAVASGYREQVVDMSPLTATTEKVQKAPLPPFLGLLGLTVGVGLVGFVRVGAQT